MISMPTRNPLWRYRQYAKYAAITAAIVVVSYGWIAGEWGRLLRALEWTVLILVPLIGLWELGERRRDREHHDEHLT